jgi:trehalose 6-phosphate phosphatase
VRAFAARELTSERQRLRVRGEDKGAIAAFHWRGAPDEEAAEAAVAEIAAAAVADGLAIHWGRKVLEVRPPVVLDKAVGVAALLRGTEVASALYVGDDSTDVDAFRGLRTLVEGGSLAHSLCVAVSSEETPEELTLEADLTVEGPAGVRELLGALLS